ncbi:CARD- and ANK-domain containing inflammasome adapter protein [Micropterus dolomieu]|uniref:CARD- and ANK-domain containing inflammasome adapter protein n=1 Tax=Micropterus dolomieu TaxID=147949 RepID=UPI001E8D6DE1|nr:CARD- and ANK-domain containing inflammasome adapter protein [Micropterus dolomieu]
MFNVLKGFDAQAASNYINPYAVDVIRAKRRDLVYGISHTEDLLDLLVTEGVMTAAKRSIVLTIRTRKDQNSRVLDILEAKGERACRKFFHPCLMLAEPDLYQRIKTYVGGVNERIRDTRRQLIGYLLERDQEGMDKMTDRIITQKTHYLFVSKETKKCSPEKEDRSPVPKSEEHKPAQSKPDNLIHLIATDGELALLEELLEDTDINIMNSSHETVLHLAAEFGHLSIIELLIRKGARVDLQDNKGRTALHRAARRGHSEIVWALAQAGAPIYTLDLQDKTPVHLAAENEHLNSVKVLVKEEKKQSESCTQEMFLHMAAMEDNWRLAEMLLQSGAAVDARNNHEKTALFYAVSRNNEKTVTVLLSAGAKVDYEVINKAIKLNEESILRLLLDNVRALGEEGLGCALYSAVKNNHDGVVSILIDSGANVNMLDKEGYTPLLLSAELGHTEVFRALLAKQAKLDATLSDLSSALHLAVHGGSVPIVQTLLERGLDPNITGPKAQTPLHLAAKCNRPECVDLLLRAGAQVNAVAQDGLTPLHIASQQGHAGPVIQLLQGKADTGVKDKVGRTALHWAASSQGESYVVDLLLSAKANPNTTDNKKKTALHLAAVEGKVDAVTSLLSHRAKGGAKDIDGSTPLHYAAAGGHASVVSTLLQLLNNKGIEERNAWRKTPLHAAAEKGHDSVAALFLEAGAKINSTDHSKDTPLHCAARGGHQEVVKRLVNWGQAEHTGQGKKVNLQATNNVGKTPLQVAESGDTPEHEHIVNLLMRKMFLIK